MPRPRGAAAPRLTRRLSQLDRRLRAQTSNLAILQSRLRCELDSEQANVAILDWQGRIVDVNAGWRAFGRENALLSPGAAKGSDYLAVCKPGTEASSGTEFKRLSDTKDAAQAKTAIQDVLAGRRESATLAYSCDSPTERRWYEMNVTPYGSGPRRGAIVRHRDVTEATIVQTELRRQSDFVRAIDESLPVIMYERVVDPDLRDYRFVSKRFKEVFGISPQSGAWASEILHPDDRERILSSYAKVVAAGGGIWHGEFRGKTAEHGMRWFRAVVSIDAVRGREVRSLGVIHDVSEEVDAAERAEHLRDHDELTGLCSRSYFERALTGALAGWNRAGRRFALVVCDIDEFREISTAYGVETGNSILRALSTSLGAAVREGDLVGRLASDQLGVIADIDSSGDADAFAHKLVTALSGQYPVGDQSVLLSVSAGVALPEDPRTTPSDLLHDATIAAAYARMAGGRATRTYSVSMGLENLARATLKADLRDAAAAGQFQLYYQPKIALATGRISGCEGLIRWNHPTLGFQSPAMFVPVAEETGLILPIGEWVLNEACRQSVRWREAGIATVPIAVNLSTVQFARSDVFEILSRALESTGAARGAIDVEVTESVFIDFSDELVETLAKIRALGVEIALDDFGTGFSSLACLARLPLSILKVDQSFVRGAVVNSSDAAIVRWVVQLAAELGLRVVAEGVETNEQLDFVTHAGCAEAQGYFFSRPVPAEQFAELLRAGAPVKA